MKTPSDWNVYEDRVRDDGLREVTFVDVLTMNIVVFDVSGAEPHSIDDEQIAGPYTKAHRLDAEGRRVGTADLVIDEYCPDMLVARLLDALRDGTVKS